ncbi:M3 family peptidase [Muribaculaceae bacterium Isolate-002 (NCI)]|nr:M3 family peptidase [Muribaculaceae bacterium Isolate-002 (NCI)]
MADNTLLQDFNTPFGTVPFDSINNSQYEEAIDAGIAKALQGVEAICNQRSVPDFENTIVALERNGKDLERALSVFFNLLSANSDDEMMEISLRVSPKLSDYSTSIALNERLWQRIKQVYDNRDKFNLSDEDKMLLQTTYDSFALNGANLQGDDRETYRALSAELSELTTKFGQNVLKELNTYEIWLNEEDLAGLPADIVAQAAADASEKGRDGEYLFTLQQPTYVAVLKYSDRPDLRERFYRLYNSRNTKGEYSNMENMKRIAELRRQIANLLGSETFAGHHLKRTMAETPANVYDLLDRLRDAYMPAMKKEMAELTQFASDTEGRPVEIKPWDYSYYANKLKNAKYSYDEEELRPYFPLDNVIDGVFGLATKLYGLTFTPNDSIQVYHPDVKAFEVRNPDGSLVGILYTDFFPRASKRPGAWMTSFREQYIDENGINVRPLVSIVMNFTKPTAEKPSLLTPYEVETFLHEFGHALHGLLADTRYSSLSGTNVYHDFVELPSQFNENYLTEKEFLDGFARHYITGDTIPQELVDKIVRSSQFGAAYACIRQLGFGYTDMAWHDAKQPIDDAVALERNATEQVKVFEPVDDMIFSPTFSHIFAGGYAAGYYGYKWAEVLDADAFAKFKETGIFDKKTADEFRDNILTRGGTENPAKLYRQFRGQDPSVDALLIRDGIKEEPSINASINKD